MADYNPVQFVNESYHELRKSTWLTRQQAVGSTIVVLVIVALIAVYISMIDYALSFLLRLLLGG